MINVILKQMTIEQHFRLDKTTHVENVKNVSKLTL